MIRRISELKPAMTSAFGRAGLDVVDEGGRLVARGACVVDWKETTGPITDKALRDWVSAFDGEDALVLITMGHFAPRAVERYLADRSIRRRAVLVEMGLRNYFEETLAPRVLCHGSRADLVDHLAAAFAEHDLELLPRRCAHCEGEPTALCSGCKALLCRSHMLICPICGDRFCHTDVAERSCFKDHRCAP